MKLRPELLSNLIENTNLLQERMKTPQLTMLDRLGMLRAQISAFEHSVETGNLLTEEEVMQLFEKEGLGRDRGSYCRNNDHINPFSCFKKENV